MIPLWDTSRRPINFAIMTALIIAANVIVFILELGGGDEFVTRWSVVPADIMMGCTMDYDSLKKAGSSVGTGAMIVMDESTCMVRALERLARFYMSESCGQCTPCREGTGWLDRMLKRIIAGQGRSEDLGLLLDVANRIEGHTICALGDAAAWPVQSFLKHFRHEFQYMIEHKGRSILGEPAAGAAVAA